MPYEIQFVASAKRQLDALAVPERTGVVAAIEDQLSHEPLVATRKNAVAPWELRIRKTRVFYNVEESTKVTILAIGTKEGNKLYIEGKEIQL